MRSKPNKNRPPAPSKESRSSARRTFLTRLWAALGLLALVELVAVGFVFIRRRKQADSPAAEAVMEIIPCGTLEHFQPGTVTAFVRGRFYLARLEDGGFLALSRQCTHLGCTVPWLEKEKRFACPCHGSAFDITGHVIQAPASRPLDIYPVTVENRMVSVDVRQAIRRVGFEKSQVTYPQST